ncbi:uncharacterized protein LOC111518917 [Drosophila willistoni]|uniref:uncharacterized protein LOC111518917 n=1 Tax=Drosophila willistoni TaxID=7260 RepID=UPI00017D7D39|nr:uncharacterized protein LOC111518917 [Drosophila willistoni]
MDIGLSLDEIIQRKRGVVDKKFKPRKVFKKPAYKPDAIPFDARNKIIQKTRAKISDAREILNQNIRASGIDARQLIHNRKKKHHQRHHYRHRSGGCGSGGGGSGRFSTPPVLPTLAVFENQQEQNLITVINRGARQLIHDRKKEHHQQQHYHHNSGGGGGVSGVGGTGGFGRCSPPQLLPSLAMLQKHLEEEQNLRTTTNRGARKMIHDRKQEHYQQQQHYHHNSGGGGVSGGGGSTVGGGSARYSPPLVSLAVLQKNLEEERNMRTKTNRGARQMIHDRKQEQQQDYHHNSGGGGVSGGSGSTGGGGGGSTGDGGSARYSPPLVSLAVLQKHLKEEQEARARAQHMNPWDSLPNDEANNFYTPSYVDHDNVEHMEMEDINSSLHISGGGGYQKISSARSPFRTNAAGMDDVEMHSSNMPGDPFGIYDPSRNRIERPTFLQPPSASRTEKHLFERRGPSHHSPPPLNDQQQRNLLATSNLPDSLTGLFRSEPDMCLSHGIYANENGHVSTTYGLPPTDGVRPPPSLLDVVANNKSGYRVLVRNLHVDVTTGDIRELFNDIGPIYNAHVVRPGTAEVIYTSLEHAQMAVDSYHQREFDGQPMHCVLINPDSCFRSVNYSANFHSNNGSLTVTTNSSGVEVDIDALHSVLFRDR